VHSIRDEKPIVFKISKDDERKMLDLPLYDDRAGKKLKLSNLYALSHRIEEDIKKKNN